MCQFCSLSFLDRFSYFSLSLSWIFDACREKEREEEKLTHPSEQRFLKPLGEREPKRTNTQQHNIIPTPILFCSRCETKHPFVTAITATYKIYQANERLFFLYFSSFVFDVVVVVVILLSHFLRYIRPGALPVHANYVWKISKHKLITHAVQAAQFASRRRNKTRQIKKKWLQTREEYAYNFPVQAIREREKCLRELDVVVVVVVVCTRHINSLRRTVESFDFIIMIWIWVFFCSLFSYFSVCFSLIFPFIFNGISFMLLLNFGSMSYAFSFGIATTDPKQGFSAPICYFLTLFLSSSILCVCWSVSERAILGKLIAFTTQAFFKTWLWLLEKHVSWSTSIHKLLLITDCIHSNYMRISCWLSVCCTM